MENDLVIVSVVWPTIALLWMGLGQYVVGLQLDRFYMVLYGYMMMALMHTLVRAIVEVFLELNKCGDDASQPCNELYRVIAEDAYIFLATATVVMIWEG